MKMHSVELERKLRLPDPGKAMEGVWRLLKRTRQQLNTTGSKAATVVGSNAETFAARKQAKIEAERARARGAYYALRTTVR